MKKALRLGVNIDHVATLRQARFTNYPSPLQAALMAEQAGADGITLHLREDRRHIQDSDVFAFRPVLNTPMNLEMAVTDEMIEIALKVKPDYVCLVPEKREELTTEGGLDVVTHYEKVSSATKTLQQAGIDVSLFIEASSPSIQAAHEMGAKCIELHTGAYAETKDKKEQEALFRQIQKIAEDAHNAGLVVNAGHGLDYHNVSKIAGIACLYELNIGHAIISRAVITGLSEAVREMKQLLIEARS